MLTRVNAPLTDFSGAMVKLRDASFPTPFAVGLEYSSPARGMWNIVHTGMLLPEGHEIFVCAAGCLRGVVLTAAEMGATDRFSTIEIRENDLVDGSLEYWIIDGVTDILQRMEALPPAVMVYTSCVHHFTGCDLDMVYRVLREKFPTVDFTDCYMNPIMRKSGLTPDQLMRRQLYSLLKPRPIDPKAVALIGNDLPSDRDSELYELLQLAGCKIHEIHDCRTYADYQQMAESSLYLTCYPSAKVAGESLAARLGSRCLHLPITFDYADIHQELEALAQTLGIALPDDAPKLEACEAALAQTRALIGDRPIAIDYTAFPCPLNLAKLLLSHGFRVTRVYADSFTPEDREAFLWMQAHYPETELYATAHPKMRFAAPKFTNEYLAIGQKAAHFTGTNHFVNLVEGGGYWGYSAIEALCRLMREACAGKEYARTCDHQRMGV